MNSDPKSCMLWIQGFCFSKLTFNAHCCRRKSHSLSVPCSPRFHQVTMTLSKDNWMKKKIRFTSLPECFRLLWIKKEQETPVLQLRVQKAHLRIPWGELENQEHVSMSSLFRICITCLLTKWAHACWCGIEGPRSSGHTALHPPERDCLWGSATRVHQIWNELRCSFLSDHCFYSMRKWVRTLWIKHGPKPQESAQSLWAACHGLCSPVPCQSVNSHFFNSFCYFFKRLFV